MGLLTLHSWEWPCGCTGKHTQMLSTVNRACLKIAVFEKDVSLKSKWNLHKKCLMNCDCPVYTFRWNSILVSVQLHVIYFLAAGDVLQNADYNRGLEQQLRLTERT